MQLEYPYSEKWNKGYLVTNTENRRNVVLYNSHTDRSTVSYARYLMSVHLGRFLEKHEEVDHIDNDKTNDTIENLQILTREENTAKNNRFIFKKQYSYMNFKCPVCLGIVKKRRGNTQAVNVHKGKITCCSRDCSYKLRTYKLDAELRELVSDEQLILAKLMSNPED